MGENLAQHPAWPESLQVEQRLREQLNDACRLARQLDEWVRSIPDGSLMDMAVVQQSGEAALSTGRRGSLAMAAAEVVGAFNEAVKLVLQSSPSYNRHGNVIMTTQMGADLSPTFSAATASPHQALASNSPSVPASVGMTSTLPGNVATAPPPRPPVNSSSPLSPSLRTTGITVKQAGGAGAQPSSKSCSPPRLTIHSPLQLSATTSDMSEGSPHAHRQQRLASAVAPYSSSADEAATPSANPVKAVLCRKRKLLPKITLKMAAASVESAESNTPPEDGHTWRKYGQKVIHGALHPRGYYRCTHKADIGCPAIKQVQRCDEEQMLFDVVYKGYHTCRSAELDKKHWPLAFSQGLCSLFNYASNSATSTHVLSSLINFSTPTTTTTTPSLMPAGPTMSSTQPPNVSSTMFLMGASGDMTNNPFVSSTNKLHPGMNIETSRAFDTTLHQVGSANKHAQEQTRVFNPLKDWSKRPFMKDSVATNERHQQFIPTNETQESLLQNERQQLLLLANERCEPMNERQEIPQVYGSMIGSKLVGSTTMQMNVITSNEQIHASLLNTSQSPNVGIDPQSPSHQQDHHFGATCSTLIFEDDMDNDNLLSDYLKSLN
ncbi:hypothetical protein L7F22_062357 [Adiantum nelumboides]|nr:hypothetical protein [Adiantum nelumboides]